MKNDKSFWKNYKIWKKCLKEYVEKTFYDTPLEKFLIKLNLKSKRIENPELVSSVLKDWKKYFNRNIPESKQLVYAITTLELLNASSPRSINKLFKKYEEKVRGPLRKSIEILTRFKGNYARNLLEKYIKMLPEKERIETLKQINYLHHLRDQSEIYH